MDDRWWTVTFSGIIREGAASASAEFSVEEQAPDEAMAVYRASRFVPLAMTVRATSAVPHD